MQRLTTAIIGTGFMGRVHLEAVLRLGFVDVRAVCGRRAEAARGLADAFGVPLAVTGYAGILEDPGIDAVHICTPNRLHTPIARAALEAGKHVLAEKPLATSPAEAATLVALAREKGTRNCTCHNLRYYPMVQQMRRMREAGELGEILVAQGTYSQDWLLYDTDWNWRADPEANGPSRALADIGSHWSDMAEHITGQRITSLAADLQTYHAMRKRPKSAVETFAGNPPAPGDYTEFPIHTEDFASVMFQMGPRTRGAFTVSQVSAGRKNRLSIEIYGSRGGVAWDQERPNELWVGRRDGKNELLIKDPVLMDERARRYADMPGGHGEGYPDTFKQVFRRFYESILDPALEPEYPQFEDGLRQLDIVDAALRSHLGRGWVEPTDTRRTTI
jgi:predicted dehydrogenase